MIASLYRGPALLLVALLLGVLPPSSAPQRAAVRLRPVGADATARVTGLDRLPGVTRYVQGTRTLRVPTYRRVLYRDVYPGVNLVYYGTDGRLEYDWRLAPHADARRIRLAVEGAGAGAPRLARARALLLSTPAGLLRQPRPVASRLGQIHHGVAARLATCRRLVVTPVA